MTETSIIIPTYNERENVRLLFESISSVLADFEIIFVDDNSPDGTADEVESLQDNRAKLLKRKQKLGLASAILEGFKLAEGNYLVMMDADLSHDSNRLASMIRAAKKADIVIGSRYIEGGQILGWSLKRRLVSKAAIFLAKPLLSMNVKDPVSGFALFRREIIEGLDGKLNPRGYKLLLEILVKSPIAVIKEIPICFKDRSTGKSKMGSKEIINYMLLCWDLWEYRRGQKW